MSEGGLDYPQMIREALRRVPREALGRIAADGLPEPHCLYLTFRTGDPGVGLAPALRRRYPDEMTIVLKQQFRDLAVDDEGFSVTLYFGGRPERLEIPFAALTAFVDTGVDFGLRFDAAVAEAPDPGRPDPGRPDPGRRRGRRPGAGLGGVDRRVPSQAVAGSFNCRLRPSPRSGPGPRGSSLRPGVCR